MWEYDDCPREDWERTEMATDRQVEALAERDMEVARLRGLLAIARDGFEKVKEAILHGKTLEAAMHCDDLHAASDPDANPS